MGRAGKVLGTIAVIAVMLAGAALVYWNVWGQAGYGASCGHSLGCKSFSCLHHALAADTADAVQAEAPGTCTKPCTADAECGAAARCVVLGADARGDLPPFGKPERACMPIALR